MKLFKYYFDEVLEEIKENFRSGCPIIWDLAESVSCLTIGRDVSSF
jgi:hypothetical protein